MEHKHLYTYAGHELHGFKQKDGEYVLYGYEVKKPDGSVAAVDVFPLVQLRLDLFKKYVEAGCPDRYSLRQYEALTATDIEMAHDNKFRKEIMI